MMHRLEYAIVTLVACAWVAATPALVAAQGAATDIGGLRAYWHVFIAYAIAIVLLLSWVISLGRRLREVEEKLGD